MSARGFILVALVAVAGLGCRQDMHDQPKYKPFRGSEFFADGRAMRPFVEGTVARGTLRDDSPFYTGKAEGEFVTEIPVEVTAELLARGQGEYQVFCSPCHGRTGMGDGMISQRGLKRQPISYHVDRLRQSPVGYYFDVITNGYGAMLDYASEVPVEDRWAIVAYVRALQLSQYALVAEVPEDRHGDLEASLQAPDAHAAEAPGEHQ